MVQYSGLKKLNEKEKKIYKDMSYLSLLFKCKQYINYIMLV